MQLEEYINKNSLSLADFALLVGVKSRATIYRYMNGRIPAPEIMEKIISLTKGKVSANDFYKLEDKNNTNKKPNVKRKIKKS